MTALLDICELIADCEHKTAPKSATGYPSIRTPNVGRGRLIFDNVNRVDEETYAKWTRRAVPQENDLIIAREAPVGNVAIIKRGENVCLGQRTVLVRPDKNKVDPEFLCFFMLGDYVQGQFGAAETGATVAHLNMRDIRGLKIPRLPGRDVQRRIASILTAYDDLIDNNMRRIDILEEMVFRLYEEWFVHFRFPGHEEVGLKESELGKIPEGWDVTQLGDVARVNPDAIKPSSAPNEIRYIDIASVSPGRIDKAERMRFSDAPGRARRIVRNGDILWSCVRPNRRSCAMVVEPKKDTVASTGFAVLRAERISQHYLYQHVKTDLFVEHLANRATGAAYPAVKAADFKEAKILIPKSRIISAFDEVASPMRGLVSKLERKNVNLRAQRDLLLPKLVSGEIDVSDIPMPDDNEVEAA